MTFLPSKIPLIQAPMAGAQGPELTIAVCRAGGLGSLPAAMLTPDRLREQIAAVRQATDAPFNVNFFTHAEPKPDPQIEARWRERLAPLLCRGGPRSIRHSRRAGARAVRRSDVRNHRRDAAGGRKLSFRPAARRVACARQGGWRARPCIRHDRRRGALARAATAPTSIIAQGREAGGHRGMFLTDDVDAQPGLIALLPQVRDAVRLPVVAAGGISDGRGIAAAFALGGDAVQIGTAYLRTPEATISPLHRAALASARDDATRLTNVFTGRPARGLVNRFVAEVGPMCEDAPLVSACRGSGRAAQGRPRKARQRRFLAALGGRSGGARARGGRRDGHATAVGGGAQAVMAALGGRYKG